MATTQSNTPMKWLLGRNLMCRIQGYDENWQTVQGTAATLASPSTPLYSTLERAALRVKNQTEEVSPISYIQENNILLKKGASVELTELLADGQCWLAYIASKCTYASVTFTRGQKVWTVSGVIEGYEETYERGKLVGTMTLSLSGGFLPTYTDAATTP